MYFLLLSLLILAVAAFISLLIPGPNRSFENYIVTGTVAGCSIGLFAAFRAVIWVPVDSIRFEWAIPFGAFSVSIDALSAFFLIPVFVLSGCAAVYGKEYLSWHAKEKSTASKWFYYNVLVIAMVLVLVARNAMLFLIAWEVMAVVSFFLVTFDDESAQVREAGFVYLIASHIGMAFLIVMFFLLGRESGSLDFEHFKILPGESGVLFILAIVGFGAKAGIEPFHVWLPEAHPAAPSHVSALMSGVMIKTGIYGLLRILTYLGPIPPWWSVLLIGLGLVSGVSGILFAMAQQDLKRLLAYSSVENIGIITLGMGISLLGMSQESLMVTILGMAGTLMHVLNHSFFKGLLFLCAGAVKHSAENLNMNMLGGLIRRMPVTGNLFLLAAVAISGIPPLNGFVSELLIYFSAFTGVRAFNGGSFVLATSVIAGIAFIGGLAIACFTKASGIIFLGEPRSKSAATASEPPALMLVPMAILGSFCIVLGLGAPMALHLVIPAVSVVTGIPVDTVLIEMSNSFDILIKLTEISLFFLFVIALVFMVRKYVLSKRIVETSVTWDCGYFRPDPSMQYTSSSFSQPVVDFFSGILRTKKNYAPPEGAFPQSASFNSYTPDFFLKSVYYPAFLAIGRYLSRLRWLQNGRVHIYILYIGLTFLILFAWKLA